MKQQIGPRSKQPEAVSRSTDNMPWFLRGLARSSQRLSHWVLVCVGGVVIGYALLLAFPKLTHWLMGERVWDLRQSPIERWALAKNKHEIATPPCEADACSYGTLLPEPAKWAPQAFQGVGRLELPAPQVHKAPPGGYFDELIDWVAGDPLMPAVLREPVADNKGEAAVEVLFKEVDANGQPRVTHATQTGFFTHAASPNIESGRLLPWPEGKKKWKEIMGHDPNDLNWAIREKARRFSTLVFQPIPSTLKVNVKKNVRVDQTQPKPGDGMAVSLKPKTFGLEGGVTSLRLDQMSVWLGVVREVQSVDGQVQITFEAATGIPTTSNTSWFSDALSGVPANGSEVWVWSIQPTQPFGEMGWKQQQEALKVQEILQSLAMDSVWRLPAEALDARCADASVPPEQGAPSCAWISIDGVAVPIQIAVLSEAVDGFLVRERPVMGNLPISGVHWSALPLKTQRFLKAYHSQPDQRVVNLMSEQYPVLKITTDKRDLRAGSSVRVLTDAKP